MVEIDGELVDLCREHLTEWSNCTDVEGIGEESCFDDPRARVVYGDAFGWFIDRFGNDGGDGNSDSGDDKGTSLEERVDVIVMDALDPDKFVEIVGSLYKDNQFVEALFHGLTEEGVSYLSLLPVRGPARRDRNDPRPRHCDGPDERSAP